MNELRELRDALRDGRNEILVDVETAADAMVPLQRMLDFPTT